VDELKRIRASGYCCSRHEWVLGGCSIAVPVFDHESKAFASLSVSGAEIRFAAEAVDTIVHALMTAGKELSRRSGFEGNYPLA
jgi:DNA-binding IclR family transcriptional regulator